MAANWERVGEARSSLFACPCPELSGVLSFPKVELLPWEGLRPHRLRVQGPGPRA